MKELLFFVDRISEGTAVVLTGEEEGLELTLPLTLLPSGVCEGDYVRASFELDEEARKRARAEIERMMDELGDNP